MKTLIQISLSAVLLVSVSGCAMFKMEKVSAWEKDILAKDEMQPGGEVIDGYIDDHIYFSKEASHGGTSVGGGGCGCN